MILAGLVATLVAAGSAVLTVDGPTGERAAGTPVDGSDPVTSSYPVLGWDPATGSDPIIGSEPTEIRIPRIGVSADLVRIGTDGAGVLQPPGPADLAGWYAGGTAPGQRGPAVIAGHVDSMAGPGVFHDVRTLQPGDRIDVLDDDGRRLGFTVRFVQRVGKDRFPTEQVYGPAPLPELRLITCGGAFDERAASYADNVIVHATFE